MPSNRRDRVAALLRAALAELVAREVKDPRVALVSVTGVDVSPDLRHARVFVAPLGATDPEAAARALAGLASARAFLQGQLGRRLALRHTPELRFALDDSFDQAARVEDLLRAARGDGGDDDA